MTQTGALRKSGALKSIIESDNIFKLPEELKNFQPMMDQDYKLEWIGWKNDGSNYNNNNICPFCAIPLEDDYKEEKEQFNSSYKKSNVRNVIEILSFFEKVQEYMNKDKKEKLDKCIKKTADDEEILLLMKKFRDELEFLVNKISNVVQFNSSQVRSEDIPNLEKVLNGLIIDPSSLDIFNNKKVIDLIKFINKAINELIKEIDLLKADIGQIKSIIGNERDRSLKDINDFLITAGINYELDIIPGSEDTSRTVLKYKAKNKVTIYLCDLIQI